MPKNILMLIDALHMINGVTISAKEMAAYWDHPDWQLNVYGTGPGKSDIKTYPHASVHFATSLLQIPFIFYDNMTFSFPIFKTQRALRVTKEEGIIHALDPGPLGLRGLWFARRHDIPYVITHFTRFTVYADMYAGWFFRWVARKMVTTAFKHSALVIAPSPAAVDEAYELGAKKVICAPIGIPIPYQSADELIVEKKPASHRVIERYNLDAQKPIIVYIGRFSVEKNIEVVLKAAESLGITILFAGEGPLIKTVEANPYTIATGVLHGQELADIYLAADLLVSASITETVGRVFLEALSYGTPLLVSEVGQHTSILPMESAIVSSFNTEAEDRGVDNLIRELQYICEQVTVKQDDSLIREAHQAGLQFSWENALSYYAELYDDILTAHEELRDKQVRLILAE